MLCYTRPTDWVAVMAVRPIEGRRKGESTEDPTGMEHQNWITSLCRHERENLVSEFTEYTCTVYSIACLCSNYTALFTQRLPSAHVLLPYSGKFSRKKTFVDFAVLEPSTKVFSVKFWGCGVWGLGVKPTC